MFSVFLFFSHHFSLAIVLVHIETKKNNFLYCSHGKQLNAFDKPEPKTCNMWVLLFFLNLVLDALTRSSRLRLNAVRTSLLVTLSKHTIRIPRTYLSTYPARQWAPLQFVVLKLSSIFPPLFFFPFRLLIAASVSSQNSCKRLWRGTTPLRSR